MGLQTMLGRRQPADRSKKPAFEAVPRRSGTTSAPAPPDAAANGLQQPAVATSITGAVIVGDAAWLGDV